MSNMIFPKFAGTGWGCTKTATFNTSIQTALNGKESRLTRQHQPRYRWKLKYNFLRDSVTTSETRELLGFFNTMRGSLEPFLFHDESDCEVVDGLVGTGDGVTKTYQLGVWRGQVYEPLFNIEEGAVLFVDGVETTAVIESGLVTFPAAPANGSEIRANFTYLHLVRFAEDSLILEELFLQLYKGELELVSVIGESAND